MTTPAPMHILALCASYNRKEKTLAAFRDLHRQRVMPNTILSFALVDDDSSDGTITAIRAEFPTTLVINSGGNKYWAGSMRLGYRTIWNQNTYTHLLVFNDDCTFFEDSLLTLSKMALSHENEHGTIVVGAMKDPETAALTYGGLIRRRWVPGVYFKKVPPTSDAQLIDTLNMNLAMVDAQTLSHNDFILDHFVHGFADFDFGLRAKESGATLLLAPHFLGECARNTITNTWQDGSLPFKLRKQLLFQPKGLPVAPRLLYLKSHAPFAWPAIFLWPYFKFYASGFLRSVFQRVGL